MALTFGELTETPVGPVSFVAGDDGLKRLAYMPLQKLKAAEGWMDDAPSLNGLEIVGALLAELNEYFFGIRKTFSVPIDWDTMTEFQRQVLSLTIDIPYGQVWTYGKVASVLGRSGAARAVGSALAANPLPVVIPCHRVVGADGRLHGYAGPQGTTTKAFLLSLEGVPVEDGRVTL